jgi:hypothetical protein
MALTALFGSRLPWRPASIGWSRFPAGKLFARRPTRWHGQPVGQLVFFAFDLLFLNGQSTAQLPLIERKERLKRLFKKEIQGLR